MKTIIRLGLNEQVDQIKMTAQEMQLEMELEFPDMKKKEETDAEFNQFVD